MLPSTRYNLPKPDYHRPMALERRATIVPVGQGCGGEPIVPGVRPDALGAMIGLRHSGRRS